MRKPAFHIYEKQKRISAVILCRLISAFVFHYSGNFKPLASPHGCTARLVSDRVGNPGDRFSCDAAHGSVVCLFQIMDETNTQISWPSKLKIGAKSKKGKI